MPSRKRMSRGMRKNLIVSVVRGSDEPLRVKQIARMMGMSRSPYLVGLLHELAEDGFLDEVNVEWMPGEYARAYIAPAAPAVVKSIPVT